MRILVIGSNGLLGKHLVGDASHMGEVYRADKFENIKGLYYVDLAKKGLVKEVFSAVKPQLVLLTASITGVDFCEKNRDLAWQVNTEGPKEVAVLAKKAGAFLVFYSSDYVFDGNNGPYSEEDTPRPINIYGQAKLEAETIIRKELKNYLIIRTCSIYGYDRDGLNYAMQVWRALNEKKTVRAVNDQYGTPTYVEDLSSITLRLINAGRSGIYNVVGPDYINRVEFADTIAGQFGLDKGLIVPIGTDELMQAAKRPEKGGLRTDKLRSELKIEALSLKDGLTAMKRRLNEK